MSATLMRSELEKYLSERRSSVGVQASACSGDRLKPELQPAETVLGAPGCSVLASAGRMFPVEMEYADTPGYVDKRPVWEQAADAFSAYVHRGGEGDVLVFMPGGFEISQTIEAIRHTSEAKGFILLPLHGELPPRDQDAAGSTLR